MSRSLDRLYDLLPVVHRMRDIDRGYPLRALLRVINEQVNVVEEDIERLYDNWFIETCEDWLVPYVADLIGYRPVSDAGDATDVRMLRDGRRGKILVPRREVANTLAFRRRKGTLALLEELAKDVAGWPARAVEFYKRLAWTQHLNHLRPERGRTVDLRGGNALDLLGGPFERTAHTLEVRRVVSHRAPGRYNVPSVGLFVWRLRPYSVTDAPACCIEAEDPQCYTFSVLGNDAPLFNEPRPEAEPTHIAGELNLPVPIRRRALEERISQRPWQTQASADYYGPGRSLSIAAPDWPTKGALQPIPRKHVIPADLSTWRYRPVRGQVAVDPVLGRIVFPPGQLPKRGVWVSYYYGFSADLGGGEYHRTLSQPIRHRLYRVEKSVPGVGEQPAAASGEVFPTIAAALAKWREEQNALGPEPIGHGTAPPDPEELQAWRTRQEQLRSAVIEIGDSAAYSEPFTIALEQGESLQIRAADRTRPVIRLLDYMSERADALSISGKRGSRFTLDGLLVTGRGFRIEGPDRADAEVFALGDLCDVHIRHCTLVPGWGIEGDCKPQRPNEASLELVYTSAKVVIEHSILGSIEIVADEVQSDPVDLSISDSIVDATRCERVAIGASTLPLGFAAARIVRSTVLGEVKVHALTLAENSIFMSHVCVGRRQIGCMRYCYVPPKSRTPRRHRCQPDGVIVVAREQQQPPAQRALLEAREVQRVRPRFVSVRYGVPAYCQLSRDCAIEIRRGADDESEMGAFHDLFQPQREANLRERLDEFTPAGMDAGILFAN